MFRRTKILLGDGLQKLHDSNVIVFGVGGVGGYVAEMLVRSGVGSITIVDFDNVDISNKNRQIIALDSTIGKPKVDVMYDRLKDINPDCNVTKINDKLLPENIERFQLDKYDYIIDAIDMVSSKISLIVYAYGHNLPIISAMGAGNRVGIPNFKVADIFETYNDGLAKVLRKKLRENNVTKHTVIFTENIATPNGDTIGSIAYYPAMCGCVLSAYVIERLIGERKMIVDINNENWKSEVLDFDGKVIVDFYGTWCMPCKMLSPILEKVLESRENVKLARVDIDENDELVNKFHIMSVPTLKFFVSGERKKETSVGLISESKILEILDRI